MFVIFLLLLAGACPWPPVQGRPLLEKRGNVNAIPVVSQVKSLAQSIAGDAEGALRTQEDFVQLCPVISQVTSAVHAAHGDNERAAQVQVAFGNNALNAFGMDFSQNHASPADGAPGGFPVDVEYPVYRPRMSYAMRGDYPDDGLEYATYDSRASASYGAGGRDYPDDGLEYATYDSRAAASYDAGGRDYPDDGLEYATYDSRASAFYDAGGRFPDDGLEYPSYYQGDSYRAGDVPRYEEEYYREDSWRPEDEGYLPDDFSGYANDAHPGPYEKTSRPFDRPPRNYD